MATAQVLAQVSANDAEIARLDKLGAAGLARHNRDWDRLQREERSRRLAQNEADWQEFQRELEAC